MKERYESCLESCRLKGSEENRIVAYFHYDSSQEFFSSTKDVDLGELREIEYYAKESGVKRIVIILTDQQKSAQEMVKEHGFVMVASSRRPVNGARYPLINLFVKNL